MDMENVLDLSPLVADYLRTIAGERSKFEKQLCVEGNLLQTSEFTN
jgi:hypothetical protein